MAVFDCPRIHAGVDVLTGVTTWFISQHGDRSRRLGRAETRLMANEPELLEAPRRTFYQRYEAAILGSVSVAVALVVWQALWSSGSISPLFFTGPSSIVSRFAQEWTEGRLKSDIAYSGTNFVIGVGLAIVSGVVFGVVIGWYRRLAM